MNLFAFHLTHTHTLFRVYKSVTAEEHMNNNNNINNTEKPPNIFPVDWLSFIFLIFPNTHKAKPYPHSVYCLRWPCSAVVISLVCSIRAASSNALSRMFAPRSMVCITIAIECEQIDGTSPI